MSVREYEKNNSIKSRGCEKNKNQEERILHLHFWRSKMTEKQEAGWEFHNREEILSLGLTFTSSHFKCEMLKPCRKPSTALKFIKLTLYSQNTYIERINKSAQGNCITAVEKWLKDINKYWNINARKNNLGIQGTIPLPMADFLRI